MRRGAGLLPLLPVLLLATLPGADAPAATPDAVAGNQVAGPDEHFAAARLQYRRGDFAAAERSYRHLVRDFPDNVDYQLGLAQTLAVTGGDDEALAVLERALELAPDYEAVWQLKHRLLVRAPDGARAEELATLRAAAALRFPASNWWRTPATPGRHSWFLQVGGEHSALSGSRPDWDARFLRVAYSTAAGHRYGLGLARSSRFDRGDNEVSVTADWQAGADWRLGLALAAAPGAGFLPERQLGLHAGRELAAGWSVDVSIKRRRFESTAANSYALLTEKYFGDFRAAWSFALTRLEGAGSAPGHTLFLNWYPRPGLGLGVAWTAGREAEAVDAGTVLETDVAGLTLTGRHALTQRWTLDWWLGTHEQGDFYRRRYAGLALAIEF
ncbi:MAG: YaiO family outer membrane beta-barrel protein [Woeseiaceae bacterium]|nr:YaiO family outer membrane beta-barrel protein [Woeseiaceae bacterium]